MGMKGREGSLMFDIIVKPAIIKCKMPGMKHPF